LSQEGEFRSGAGGPAHDRLIEPELRDVRLDTIRLLHEACEVEHSLMLQYLYAAYSIKPQYEALAGSVDEPRSFIGIAVEEMHHLREVNRILVELGGAPNLTRQDFPIEPSIYPFDMKLERLSRASAGRYAFAEAPPRAREQAGRPSDLVDEIAGELDAVDPSDDRWNHVGSLYRALIARVGILAEGGACSPEQASEWIQVLKEIQEEGEGLHFEFLRDVFLGVEGPLSRDGAPNVWTLDPDDEAYPSNPVPTNPSALASAHAPMTGVLGEIARVGNLAYWASLLMIDHGYRAQIGLGVRDPGTRGLEFVHALMTEGIGVLCVVLSENGAGMPFDPLSLGYAPCVEAARNMRAAASLLGEARDRLSELSPPAGSERKIERAIRALEEAQSAAEEEATRVGRVVVVGAGPSGLAAAFALADRGVPVELIEQGPVIGGKVYSEETSDGLRRSVEHGVHGWWPAYRNFDALLQNSGVDLDQAFIGQERSFLVLRPHEIVELKPLPFRLPSPIFLAVQTLLSEYAGGLRTSLQMIRFSVHLLAFDHAKDFERYDDESLETFMERTGVPENVAEFLFEPFTVNFAYLTPAEISAAAVLSAFQSYVLPDQNASLPRWSRGLPNRTIFGPILRAIRARGASVRVSTSARSVAIEDGQVRGIEVETIGQGQSNGEKVFVGVVEQAEVPPEGWKRFEFPETTDVFVRRKSGGEFEVFLPRCTHHGGDLAWNSEDRTFACQRHSGVFDESGEVISGPPLEALWTQPEPNVRGDGTIEIQAYSDVRRLECQDAIVATDVVAATRMLERSPGVSEGLLSALRGLDGTPVLVVRMWFPRGQQISPETYPTAVPKACELVDNFFYLNHFDDSYDREGEVVEVQGARFYARWKDMPEDAIVDWVLDDMKRVGLVVADLPFPEHFEVLRHPRVFTRFDPGSGKLRPDADARVSGLHLAGDWTRADWSTWFMEGSVVSGLRAANRVLTNRGLEPYPIEPLPREGIILRLTRFIARCVRPLLD